MKAGLLNSNIHILKPFTTISRYGENKTEYRAMYQTKANVKFENTQRTIENNEVIYDLNVIFKMRIFTPIDEWCRILYHNVEYRILTLIRDDVNRTITVTTQRVNE